jgi:hypothetical protein
MFYTVRALQLRIRCCGLIMHLKSPTDLAWYSAHRNQHRAAWWLALLARIPGKAGEVIGLVLLRWEGSPDYLTLRALRVAVRCTPDAFCVACRDGAL